MLEEINIKDDKIIYNNIKENNEYVIKYLFDKNIKSIEYKLV